MSEEKQIRLLIVDDDKIMTRTLKTMISKKYSMIEIETAEGGYQALQRIGRGGIDAVLTDVAMPDMDGCDLYIKICHSNPEIQVIMMSAFYDANHAVVRAKMEGLEDVVPSPALIEKKDLIEKIFQKIEEHFLKKRE